MMIEDRAEREVGEVRPWRLLSDRRSWRGPFISQSVGRSVTFPGGGRPTCDTLCCIEMVFLFSMLLSCTLSQPAGHGHTDCFVLLHALLMALSKQIAHIHT
ncbi:unnamed protein product [Periconia digitata]|uniref:Uncharacterized protein n=1 Tax=Periconia digitata TaxID=1303443 RepID=A0A9W4U3Y1_9PLEO|nr:unnamed protein product [Periconia digitata]